MDSETLVIKAAQKQQLFSMFYPRGILCSAKDFYLVVVLLSAIHILVSCKQCLVNEGLNQLEFETSDASEILSEGSSSTGLKLTRSINSLQKSVEGLVILLCSGHQFDSSIGYAEEFYNFNYINGKQRPLSSVPPTSEIEAVDARGHGGSLSLVLLEGSEPVQTLEFKLNLPTRLNFSSADILHYMGSKNYSCSQPLTEEVYAKNTGDLPLEVIRIKVSRTVCGLYGLLVDNCKDRSLQPGESVRLPISYQSDFPTATIQRDLEPPLATGIPVMPMKASLPIRVLNFCERWALVKKALLVFLFAASALFLLVCVLFSRIPAIASEDFKSWKNSVSTTIHALNTLHNLKNSDAMSPELNVFIKPIAREEALLLESNSTSPIVDPSDGHQKQTNSLLDTGQETNLVSTLPSKSSSGENSHMSSDSQSLRVKSGKERGRRRRKTKSSGSGVVLFEVSSSQSGTSTPSSPSSPVASKTPKRLVSPRMEKSVSARNPFSQALDLHRIKSKCSEPSSMVNILDNEMALRTEKPSLTRKVAGRAVLSPSATFPGAGRAVPTWTCDTLFFASTSTIAPYARAPRTKLHNRKTIKLKEKMGFEEKFIYDIWGDHLFGLPLTYQSKGVPTNKSQSFFVRDPQTLMTNSVTEKPVSPNVEGNE